MRRAAAFVLGMGGGDTTPPIVSSIATSTDGLSVDITFNEPMNTSSGAAGDFAIGDATNAPTVDSRAWQSSTVLRLTLSTAILASHIDASPKLSYTGAGGGDPVQDAAGNDLANFGPSAVTNNSTALVVLDTDWLTYLDADDGPVGTPSTAVGNPITDWLTLAGSYDWEQTNSADRGTLSNTTMSGGRLTVDFDGTSDHMQTVLNLAAELEGNNIPFLLYVHVYTITKKTSGVYCAIGDTTSTIRYDLTRQNGTLDSINILRRGAGGNPNTSVGSPGVGEHTYVGRLHGATKTFHIDGTKVADAIAFDAGDISSLNTCTMAAWITTSTLNFANIGIRRLGIRLGAGTDADAAALYTLHGK